MNKKTVLVVDDDPDMKEIMGIILKQEGYNLICCSRALEIEKIVKAIKIDLIILDYLLVGKRSGVDVYNEMRARGDKTPIIFMTAMHEGVCEKIDVLKDEACLIRKPFEISDLIKAIKSYI